MKDSTNVFARRSQELAGSGGVTLEFLIELHNACRKFEPMMHPSQASGSCCFDQWLAKIIL